ncbi:hypothetical protein Vretifemale_14935, partial [Volvox reticuliferus]
MGVAPRLVRHNLVLRRPGHDTAYRGRRPPPLLTTSPPPPPPSPPPACRPLLLHRTPPSALPSAGWRTTKPTVPAASYLIRNPLAATLTIGFHTMPSAAAEGYREMPPSARGGSDGAVGRPPPGPSLSGCIRYRAMLPGRRMFSHLAPAARPRIGGGTVRRDGRTRPVFAPPPAFQSQPELRPCNVPA